jgi:hypothetical protein
MMRQWVNERLDEENAAFDIQQMKIEATQDWGPDPTPEEMRQHRRRFVFDMAKSAAQDHDDVRLLRKLYTEIADFIHPRKRKRGQRRRPRGNWIKRWHLRVAIDDVHRIRGIWVQHYGKRNRPRGTVTAEAIAAERHDLTEDEVRSAKNHGARRAR